MVGRWYTTRREVVPSRFLEGHPTSLQRCPIYSRPQLLAGCVRSGKLGSSLQHPLQCRRSSACSSTCGVGLCQMLWQSLRLPHRCVISAGLGAWTYRGGLARVECRRIGTSWSHGCSGLMLQTCQGVLLCGSRWYARGAYMVCNFPVRSQPPSWRLVIHIVECPMIDHIRWSITYFIGHPLSHVRDVIGCCSIFNIWSLVARVAACETFLLKNKKVPVRNSWGVNFRVQSRASRQLR